MKSTYNERSDENSEADEINIFTTQTKKTSQRHDEAIYILLFFTCFLVQFLIFWYVYSILSIHALNIPSVIVRDVRKQIH
jgi:hypothetical protein